MTTKVQMDAPLYMQVIALMASAIGSYFLSGWIVYRLADLRIPQKYRRVDGFHRWGTYIIHRTRPIRGSIRKYDPRDGARDDYAPWLFWSALMDLGCLVVFVALFAGTVGVLVWVVGRVG